MQCPLQDDLTVQDGVEFGTLEQTSEGPRRHNAAPRKIAKKALTQLHLDLGQVCFVRQTSSLVSTFLEKHMDDLCAHILRSLRSLTMYAPCRTTSLAESASFAG